MLRRIVVVLVVLAGIAMVLAVGYRIRNPEKLTLDADARKEASGQFVTLGDGVTHYQLGGPDSGQRVALVHGFSTPYYIWDSTFIALTGAGFRVLRYDTFGRGYSDRPDIAYNVELFDRQLNQLLDSVGWREPVDVVGLSMGGLVVGAFTGRHPERVRSMTMVDPAAGENGLMPAMFSAPLIGRWLWQMTAMPGMADGQSGDFLEPAKWPDWADRYRMQMRYRGFGRALLSTRMQNAGLHYDTLYAHVGAAGTRSLLIWGKQDSVVLITEAPGVVKAIPQIRFETIDRAAHLPHMERTDVVNPMLIEFLRAGRPAAPAPASP